MKLSTNQEYKTLLHEIKGSIKASRVKAIFAVNQELLLMYWNIGTMILERQKLHSWGQKIISQIATDLKKEFVEDQGFSKSNLSYMMQFAKEYRYEEIVQAPLGQLTWYHNITLLQKIKDKNIRLWYANQALEFGWSRNVMVLHIESELHKKQGNLPTNFTLTLPKEQSDLAQNTFKDPYILHFLGLEKNAREREIEDAMMKHITSFLLELGQGFAFLGRQYPIEVSNKEYKIDLLFYHMKLRCFVVIDLKARAFLPEDAGKINFYVNAVDEYMKKEYDNPTIGIVLCKSKDNVLAEFALKGISTPVGVAEFRLTEALPDNIQSSFPTIEALEEELRNISIDENN